MSNFVKMDIDLEVELAAEVAKIWIDKHACPPSQDVFDQIVFDKPNTIREDLDIETLEHAIGAAVINQILLDAINMAMEKEKNANKK